MDRPIHRVVDLIAPESQLILNMDVAQARGVLLGQTPGGAASIEGSFALVVNPDCASRQDPRFRRLPTRPLSGRSLQRVPAAR